MNMTPSCLGLCGSLIEHNVELRKFWRKLLSTLTDESLLSDMFSALMSCDDMPWPYHLRIRLKATTSMYCRHKHVDRSSELCCVTNVLQLN